MNLSDFFGQTPRALRMLAQFRGRDSRAEFWPYAAVVFVATQIIGMVIMLPVLFSNIFSNIEKMDRLSRENPQDWVVTRSPGGVSYNYVGNDPSALGQLMPDMSGIIVISGTVFVVSCVILASAVTRRLHDRGHSGFWALIPTILGCSALYFMADMFGNFPSAAASSAMSFMAAFMNNLAYMVTLIILTVHLALRGSSAPNAYGPPPGHIPDEGPA